MSAKKRLLLAVAASALATAHAVASKPLTIHFGPAAAPAARPAEQPAVVFSIPRYTLPPAERETVAACLVLEAASQGDYGMRAVMAVIRNRAGGHPEAFALTTLRPRQFSAFNRVTAGYEPLSRAIARAQRDRMWACALAIVDAAARDAWHDPTDGATHYTRTGERIHWTRGLAKTVTIGAHSFYR